MFYKTSLQSETGKKFAEFIDRRKKCEKAQDDLVKKVGAKSCRIGYWRVHGGVSSFIFDNPPDQKHWKRVRMNEYMPKLNTKVGKQIDEKISNLPQLQPNDLNSCIGWKPGIFKSIGYVYDKSADVVGFAVLPEWLDEITIPSDCQEITYSEYKSISTTGKPELITENTERK